MLEHALFNAALPYRVYGGMRFFERAEVKHALAYLRLIAAPEDDGAFLRVVNFPPRGIGARTLETLQDASAGAGTSLWQAACERRRHRQGGREPRGVSWAGRGDARRDARGCRCRRRSSTSSQARGLLAHYRAEKDGQERVENLEELVNAAEGFLREADLAVDAPMVAGDDRRRTTLAARARPIR